MTKGKNSSCSMLSKNSACTYEECKSCKMALIKFNHVLVSVPDFEDVPKGFCCFIKESASWDK
jgi:hypothetical protein